MTRTIVVGYDGSEIAKAALACGARRAGDAGRVIVVQAVTSPTMFIETEYYEQSLEHARERGEASMRELDDLLAGVESEPRIEEGPPARTLVSVAREADADEIVVGSRGFGAGRAALGSVSHALLHEADRPVVILTRAAAQREERRAASDRTSDGHGVVIVGYDGSDTARAALGYATAHAGGRIVVVTAYDAPASYLGRPYYGKALRASQLRGQELLDELARGDGLPEDAVFDLLEGPPAEALAGAALARDAAEIVVGSRGLGRFRGAFGSVSHALLHEAQHPVVVVPQPSPE
jgi:nucleotide-binding universal stress UspA family protein